MEGERMSQQDILRALQQYRHDVANHLQLISGYLSMDRSDKITENVDNWINQLENERKLFNLNLPDLTVWLLHHHVNYPHLRLTYDVSITKKQFTVYDNRLVTCLESLFRDISEWVDPVKLSNVRISFTMNQNEQPVVKVSVKKVDLLKIEDIVDSLNITVRNEEEYKVYELMIME